MLAEAFKFAVQNNSGAVVDMFVEVFPWKFNSAGALEYDASSPTIVTTGAVLDGNSGETGVFDNAAGLWLGAHLEFIFTGGGSTGAIAYLLPNTASELTMAFASVADVATSGVGRIPAEL